MSDLPRLLDDIRGWYAASTLALGERTGLLAALLQGPASAGELARTSGTDERNARAWGDAVVAAGYARLEDGHYVAVDDEVAMLRGSFLDFRAVLDCLFRLGALAPRVEQAMRDGEGIPSAEVQAGLGAAVGRVNEPLWPFVLVDDWLAAHPDEVSRLRAGIDVAEIGCGNGSALLTLAEEFPASRFVGLEIDPGGIALATMRVAQSGLSNVAVRLTDGSLPASAYDLVCMFDAFHHVPDPESLLDAMHATLRPGGAILVAEPAGTGDPNVDAEDPMAVVTYGCDLLYCLQEALAGGGHGFGAAGARRGLEPLLAAHGFADPAVHESQAGYAVLRAVRA